MPALADLAGPGDPCRRGPGPPGAVVVLAEFEDPAQAAAVFGEDSGSYREVDRPRVAGATRRARVFAGYAGWGPADSRPNSRRRLDPRAPAPDDVFADEDPEGLWRVVLRRKGGDYALLSTMPGDPSVN